MKDIDSEEIFRLLENLSCAELETVINEAGIYAGYAGKELIEQDDMIKACMRVIFGAPECISSIDNTNNIKVAVHEAGHAVIAEILSPGSVSLVSICRYSGSVRGVTKIHRSDDYKLSKEQKENDIISSLGGKAATEMIFGIADVGCYYDMDHVFESVNLLADNLCTLGFESYVRPDSSGYVSENRERLIASEVNRYYQIAKRIIAENKPFLDAVIEALMDYKTVTYREMQRIKKNYRKKEV